MLKKCREIIVKNQSNQIAEKNILSVFLSNEKTFVKIWWNWRKTVNITLVLLIFSGENNYFVAFKGCYNSKFLLIDCRQKKYLKKISSSPWRINLKCP